jgi:hypothetical protein
MVKPALTDGSARWLLRRHKIVLVAPLPMARPQGERFARIFRESWGRIPGGPRRSVLKHWRADPSPLPAIKPEIALVPDWPGRQQGVMAMAKCRGHILLFRLSDVKRFPDELVAALIAHELAHVYQWSIGHDVGSLDALESEGEADWLMGSWGFSPRAIDEWMLANRRKKLP